MMRETHNLTTDEGQGLYTPKPKPGLTDNDFTPHSYLLRIHTTHCSQCSAETQHSETFLVKTHKDYTANTALRMLVKVETLTSTLPVGVTYLKTKHSPICHLCWQQTPTSLSPRETEERAWEEALRASAQRERETSMRAAMAKAREAQAKTRININNLPL